MENYIKAYLKAEDAINEALNKFRQSGEDPDIAIRLLQDLVIPAYNESVSPLIGHTIKKLMALKEEH